MATIGSIILGVAGLLLAGFMVMAGSVPVIYGKPPISSREAFIWAGLLAVGSIALLVTA